VTRRGIISYGETELDLTGLEQIVSTCRQMLYLCSITKPSVVGNSGISLYDALKHLDGTIDSIGLDTSLQRGHFNVLWQDRDYSSTGAVNRLRKDGSIKALIC
jgi:hypothetical protein